MTRDEAKEGLCRILGNYYRISNEHLLKEIDVAEEINALKMAIEALERKQGKNISEDGFLCSVCTFGDFGGFHGYEPNFCPNCGTDMKTCENE